MTNSTVNHRGLESARRAGDEVVKKVSHIQEAFRWTWHAKSGISGDM